MNKEKLIENFKTHETGKLFPLCADFCLTDDDFRQISEICHQPSVYELFKERLQGKEYTISDAKGFYDWANSGWNEDKFFVFLIRDSNGKICCAVDIKSNNLDGAEIGYWASEDSPGFITNAVEKLCEFGKEKGFKMLYGLTVPQNLKSQNVLMRAGFKNCGKVQEKKEYFRFEKVLS